MLRKIGNEFAEDALENSDSANSQVPYDLVIKQFESIGLRKLTGLCTDGASVMVGKREGLAESLGETARV